jgi:hypothetical protein
MPRINKIKRSDYNRILITETLPYETPIIFSNDGLYDRVANIDSADEIQKTFLKALVFGEALPKSVNSTIPYLYKVRKNSDEFRRLALLHPMSQWKIRCFYEKYESLILHYCSVSQASIRAPNTVAGSFYNKSSWENVNQYKTGNVSLSSTDKYAKHTPSYFSYRGFDRLYKFFNSRDYFSLEKRFSTLLTLDVSKCFDSIYTHCLSWALKDKQFTKKNVDVSTTFAQEFDSIIRHGNHNETNGIPIGPEVSRIFAEILFQEIDRQVISRLKDKTFDVDYTFRRYVDDVFIFAKDDQIAKLVYKTYADVLVSFNLHANSSKSVHLARPFLTRKSRLIDEASGKTNEFFDKFLTGDGSISVSPKRIFSPWRLTKSYIDSIKTLCSHNSVNYDEVASFLISVVTERIKKLVTCNSAALDAEGRQRYFSAILILLDIQFFFYSVAPSVSASYKLSTSIILSIRFIREHIPENIELVSQRIYDLVATLLTDECGRPEVAGVEGFISLESLNIVLASRELGDNYLLPEAILDRLFIGNRDLAYFTIISCLFYIRTNSQFDAIRMRIISNISTKLDDLSNVFMDCEQAYLLLDALSCPFIPQSKRLTWARALYVTMAKAVPGKEELIHFLKQAEQESWQVSWTDVDLLNSLEKKELKQAY